MGERIIDPKFNIQEVYRTMNILNPYRFGGGGGGGYLLDDYPDASLAYSFRKLSSTQTNCVRLRRGSDNVEQDFGFVNDYLDTSGVSVFLGANTGYITTMYDQSVNGVNWVNLTQSTQPTLALSKIDSYAAINVVNTENLTASFSASFLTNSSCEFAVASNISSNTYFCISSESPGGKYYGIGQSGSGSGPNNNSGVPNYYFNSVLTNSVTRGLIYTEMTGIVLKQVSMENLSLSLFSDINLNFKAAGSIKAVSNTFEKIIYPNNTNRVAIQDNINAYYSIY